MTSSIHHLQLIVTAGTNNQSLAMDSLPCDVLGDVLALLPPRSLAACRGVCRAWRAAVDAGGHLRADLLPLTVRGVFVESDTPSSPYFFRRPSSSTIAGAALDYLQDMGYDLDIAMISGSCNGLLLLEQCVVNPATRRWARLPPYPPSPEKKMEGFHYKECIAFDPAVSPHYRVVRLPYVPDYLKGKFDAGLEWPTDPFVIQVFSSGSRSSGTKHSM